MLGVRLLVVLVLVVACVAETLRAPPDEFRKKLAGPPSEFEQFYIPDPVSGALDGSAAFQTIELKQKGGVLVWEGPLAVDSTTEFTLGIFSQYEDQIDLVVTQPNGARASQPTKRKSPYGIDGATFPLTTWTWAKPTAGTWQAQIKCSAKVDKDSVQAMLLLHNDSPIKIFSHLNTYDLQLGQDIGLIANLHDSSVSQLDESGRPTPMLFPAESLSAQMEVVFPDGSQHFIPMHDDGKHADLKASDGIYGAILQASEDGAYTVQAIFSGVTSSGTPFLRSNEHLVNVVRPLITVTGLATADLNSEKDTVIFHIDVDLLDDVIPPGLTVKAYTEVWGTDQTGLEYVPVAWLQAMVDPIEYANRKVVTLQMDTNWLHLAQASTPLQLRNVWLEDRDYSIPYSERDAVFVEIPNRSKLNSFRPNTMLKDMPITQKMREGPRPRALLNATAANPKLILVHGYCAGQNEFPLSQFTNAVQFQDYKQSRTNDQFALKIKDFADSQGITSFGIVGHSQAGLASTHLHTYYFSGLEQATGGQLIQSVGSPYGGTALAGSLAGVGGLFGLGCGTNYDLTRDGAKLWSASIPTTATKDVDFYLTQYGSSGYCAWGANLVLAKPNDGTTEVAYGSIKGANNKGTKSSWCHTTGMTSPNQCTDPDRNAILNRGAAR